MKKFLGLLLVLCFNNSYALVSLELSVDAAKLETIEFLSKYKENGKIIVRKTKVKEYNLPTLSGTFVFDSEEEFQEFQRKNKLSFLNKIPTLENKFKVATEDVQKEIWKTKNKWNDDWEKKYSEWIKENVDEKFFQKYQIKVDCADVAYSLRWIFSRINKLPMIVTFQDTGVKFSNRSFKSSWKSLERSTLWHKDKLFIKSLNYILGHTSTKTLPEDTYAINDSPEILQAGIVNYLGGHTQVIAHVNFDSLEDYPVYTLESTIPAEARELSRQALANGQDLRQFKWVEDKEQSTPSHREGINSFLIQEYVKKHNLKFSPDKVLEAFLSSLKEMFLNREEYVLEGYRFCQKNKCNYDSTDYDNYSTSSRDKRIFLRYNDMKKIISQVKESFSVKNETYNLDFHLSKMDICLDGFDVEPLEYFKYFQMRLISPDPRDSLNLRWAKNELEILTSKFKKLKKSLNARSEIVNEDSLCKLPSCYPGSKSWNTLETYELDKKIKSELSSIYKICQVSSDVKGINLCSNKHKAFIDNKIGVDSNNLWLLTSNPNHDLFYRNGLHSKNYQITLFNNLIKYSGYDAESGGISGVQNLILFDNDTLVMDEGIYDFSSDQLKKFEHELQYSSSSQGVVDLNFWDKDKVYNVQYTSNGKRFDSSKIEGSVVLVSGDYILSYDEHNSQDTYSLDLYVYKVLDGVLKKEKCLSFSSAQPIYLENSDKLNIIYTDEEDGRKNLSAFQMLGGEIVFGDLKDFSIPSIDTYRSKFLSRNIISLSYSDYDERQDLETYQNSIIDLSLKKLVYSSNKDEVFHSPRVGHEYYPKSDDVESLDDLFRSAGKVFILDDEFKRIKTIDYLLEVSVSNDFLYLMTKKHFVKVDKVTGESTQLASFPKNELCFVLSSKEGYCLEKSLVSKAFKKVKAEMPSKIIDLKTGKVLREIKNTFVLFDFDEVNESQSLLTEIVDTKTDEILGSDDDNSKLDVFSRSKSNQLVQPLISINNLGDGDEESFYPLGEEAYIYYTKYNYIIIREK